MIDLAYGETLYADPSSHCCPPPTQRFEQTPPAAQLKCLTLRR